MVFMNAYLPNILRLNLWMYLSMGTCGCCLLLFQLNRLDRLVFQKYTAKYLQSAEERFLLGVIGTAGIAGFGWCSYLFYVTLRQSKTPPHEPDGYMLPTDEMANWSTWILYILVLISCVYSFYVMSGSRDKFSLVSSERFLQKLGMNAKVAETRRTFISKIPKKIDRPPRITAARGRFGKKLEKYKNKLRDLEKVWKILYRIAAAAYMEAKQVYVRIKYANPAFKSLYFAWPDVSYGIRFRTALILNTLLIVGSCLIGLWFDDYFSAVLTKYYATYISMVLDAGMKDRDWFDEIWTNKGGLGTLQQVVVIFFARSSKQGAPFFLHFLESFRYASIFSTMSATFIILARITIMGIEQRTTICNLRMGLVKKEIGNVKSIRLIDGCSYLGSQAILMFFGWFAFYVFAYTGVFALSWNTTRRILFRLWFPMAVVSIFLYMCSFWLARTRAIRNPGLTVSGRGQYAFSEFSLLFVNVMLGPFFVFARFLLAVMRTMMTWFLLHNKLHEVDEDSGVGNGMYKSAMYVQHAHNNPVTRALVERLHEQLRNMDTMRRFPPDNIEPDRLKREIHENKTSKVHRRIISRLLLLLMMQANDHHNLKTFRKQHLLIYQRKSRKGVFLAGAGDDEAEVDPSAVQVEGAEAGFSNEMHSTEWEEGEDEEEEVMEKDPDWDEPSECQDTSRRSTSRSLPKFGGLMSSRESARGQKGGDGKPLNDE